MPGFCYIRPCDAEELIGAWAVALSAESRPTMLSIARDPTGPVPNTDRKLEQRGAYVTRGRDDYEVTLLQEDGYRNTVFPQDGKPIVSVEEYVATTWARYITASIGMTTYEYSASNCSNYDRFGLDAQGIEKKVKPYLAFLNGRSAREVGWRQL
ncbi:hypothetical protein J7T55_011307 [Diaporthe amygdali]|uniref:uncharacterized protein n=1 Tax=Phomopsis amygdali TaxID=1214568 RepID=UPI0022FE7D21|nr:uncharacterized protein J7T55_011307 [Diaporthe amygdali]KAJ0108816.1 hypothetical protein J7T55_011307 [Diaporthe amygdali]